MSDYFLNLKLATVLIRENFTAVVLLGRLYFSMICLINSLSVVVSLKDCLGVLPLGSGFIIWSPLAQSGNRNFHGY
jgi:hypothetical protein